MSCLVHVNAVKCNLTELTTRSTCFNLLVSGVCEMRMYQDLDPVCILAWSSAFRVQPFWCVWQLLAYFIQHGRITKISVVTQFISGFFPPLFHWCSQCDGCLLSSLPRWGSWPGCQDFPAKLGAKSGSSWVSQAPNLHLAMQLLTFDFEALVKTSSSCFSVTCALYVLSKKHTGHKSSACRAWQSQQDLTQWYLFGSADL